MHSPTRITEDEFAEWFLTVVHNFLHMLSVCTIAPSASIHDLTSAHTYVVNASTELRQSINVHLRFDAPDAGTAVQADADVHQLLDRLESKWFTMWARGHIDMVSSFAEWCDVQQSETRKKVQTLMDATGRWRSKVDDMIRGHQDHVGRDTRNLTEKWSLFCQQYNDLLPSPTEGFDYESSLRDVMKRLPGYVDLAGMVHQFMNHWFFTSKISMKPVDIRIMVSTIELKKLNQQLADMIRVRETSTVEEEDRKLLKILVSKKQEQTSKLKAVVQQCTFDKQPHRMWLTTCYMFLPLFVDVENRMFNIMLTATHMHNSINELQYEMIAHILKETNQSMAKHIQSCKSTIREQLEPFAHNRSMIRRYMYRGGGVGDQEEVGVANDDDALNFRKHITDDLALAVFTDINRLLEEGPVRSVMSKAGRRRAGVGGEATPIRSESDYPQCS